MEQADIRMNALEEAFVSVFAIVTETAKGLKPAGKVDSLVEKVDSLADALANSDERLNIFIITAERYISSRCNGESTA